MLSHLFNTPCTLLSRTAGEEDDYGNETDDTIETTTVCELQQQRRDEPPAEGETSDTQWQVFFRPDEVLDTAAAIRVDGVVYELVGDPWTVRDPWRQAVSHIEATARRVAGSRDA